MQADHQPSRQYKVMVIFVVLTMCLTPLGSSIAQQLPDPPVDVTESSSWGVGTLSDLQLRYLISQMTLFEEINIVHGNTDNTCSTANISPSVQGCVGQAGYITGVVRLGIPPLRLVDGPAGIRLSHEATALPAPAGLTASFDPAAARLFGTVMGREGRAINQDVLLAPMMNQVGIPTAGRNFETTGEDPYLASQIAGQLVTGVQDQGLIATLKHYVTNDFENGRNSTSVKIDERTLYEMELQPFEAGVKAGAGAVMCSYNRINDVYACSNDQTQNQILRTEFGFTGWIMSDWGATHRSSDLIYGLDMAMPSGSTGNGWADSVLTSAVLTGTPVVSLTNDFPAVPAYSSAQWKAAMDEAVFRILKQMNNAGLLEGTIFGSHYTDGTPYIPPRADLAALKPGSFAAAQLIAEESATLLKNQNNLLPLASSDFSGNGVLVMGPTSVAPYIGGGGSANVTPYVNVQSPFSALKATAGVGANLAYVPGYDLDGVIMPSSPISAPLSSPYAGQNGWLRTQISTTVPVSGTEPGACVDSCAPDQLDATVDYITTTLPISTAWRWQGTFTAPAAGSWQLKIFVKNQSGAQLFVDGLAYTPNRRINLGTYGTTGGIGGSSISNWDKMTQTSKSHDPDLPRLQQGAYSVTFTLGETHTLDLRAYATGTFTEPLQIQFRWVPPNWQAQAINAAVTAAATANKVIIFAYDEGTEGSDRGGNNPAAGMVLPGYQDALISAVVAANPNIIVVLNTGDPVFMPWVNNVPAILEMWYPGQMGGVATANVLRGVVNPGGKLPVTFPADGTHYPQYDPNCTNTATNGNCPLYPGVAQAGFISGTHSYRQIDFTTNGIFQGYRWYDKNNVTPLFPFGHGLSYTQFDYSNLSVQANGDGFDVSFRVRNSGSVLGSEVPQVYLGAPTNPIVPMAAKALVGFDRVTLAPGQSQQITLHIGQRQLSYWSVEGHDWVLAVGTRSVYVGSSSRDIRLTGSLYVPNLSVAELINEMTLDEKLGMLHGVGFFSPATPTRCLSSAGYVNGVARLNVPGLCMSDGPAGVRVSQPATALPAPVGLASTFNPALAYRYGQVMGQEGRAYGQDVLLSPMVNNVRIPYAGRNFETLGEDPFLAGRIVGSEVEAIQDAGLIATIKHYAENNQENNRQGVNVNVDEKTLHEIELAGFEAAINAGAGAVMCAYNKVNGTYACENSVLLNDILRTQWGFTGLVMTDWFASHPNGVNALTAGLDIEMPGEVAFGAQLKQAVISGTIPLSTVDAAVRRILTSMDQVGLLDDSIGPRPSIDAIKDADAAVAREVAEQGAVLLRNQNHTLPFDAADQQALVVVGPTAKTPLIGGGGSARVTPFHMVSALDALTQTIGAGGHVTYAMGIDLDGVVVPSTVLSFTQAYSTFTDINFVGANALPATTGTYTWTGVLTAPTTGAYDLKVQNVNGSGAFRIDGVQLASIGGFFGGGSLIPTADGLTNNSATINLTAGTHPFTLTVGATGFFGPPSPTGPIQLRFAWVTPEWRQAKLAEAVAAAQSANAVVVFGYVEGSEGVDRNSLALPGGQDDLIAAVTAANPNNVVVLNVPAAVTMPWVNQAGAILNMWFPGQEGGYATADLLLGKANPGGKLPITFPQSESDLATYGKPEMYPGVTNQEYYSETTYVGYRWFDKEGLNPLFPFGHGLSYAEFEYSNLSVVPSGDGYDVKFTVKNTSAITGTEVPQVYLGPSSAAMQKMAPESVAAIPHEKKLAGFQRLVLTPGQSQQVTIHVGARELSSWSTVVHDWVRNSGVPTVYVGSSSRDLRLMTSPILTYVFLPLVTR